MIQRIQTVFLLISSALISILFFIPLITFSGANGDFTLYTDKLIQIGGANSVTIGVEWPIFLMVGIMMLLPFVTIFLYKTLMLQIRFCVFSSILNALFYALYFYEGYLISGALESGYSVKVFPLILPALSIVFNIIALKRIAVDDMLLKSINRIR